MISVIMPTFNGSDTLLRTVDAFKHLVAPPGGVEFVFVDNASTDTSGKILEAYRDTLKAQLIYESQRGKSFALNAAIAASTGEFLVFFDDDVIPDPDCLIEYLAAAQKFPAAGVFTGQIRPDWQTTPPDWLVHLTDLGRSWGCTPLDRSEGPVRFTQVKGGNMMICRFALGRRGFNTEWLNFSGSSGGGGTEDTALAKLLSADGHEIIYVPSARVMHIIQPNEMTWKAVFKRYFRIGQMANIRDEILEGATRGKARPRSRVGGLGAVGLLLEAILLCLVGRQRVAAERMVDGAQALGRYASRNPLFRSILRNRVDTSRDDGAYKVP